MAPRRGYVIGVGVERVFERVLRARTAYVVSPWISEPYASRLLKMVREGRAFVVTSMSSDNAFYNHLMNTKPDNISTRPSEVGETPAKVSTWHDYGIAIAVLITLILAAIKPVLAIIGVLALVIIIADMYERKRRRGVAWFENVRLSPGLDEEGFIHVKLYIADDEAWVGSANMTQASWNKNIDVLVPIDVETARRIFDEVWRMAKPLTNVMSISQFLQSPKPIETKPVN